MIDALFTPPPTPLPEHREFLVPLIQIDHGDWCYERDQSDCPEDGDCENTCGICLRPLVEDRECTNCGITYTSDNYARLTNPAIPVCGQPNPNPLPQIPDRDRLILHGFCKLPRGHGGRHHYPHRNVDREAYFAARDAA